MQGSSMNVLTAYKSTDEARQCSQAAWDAAEKCSASIYQDVTDSANTIGAGEVTVSCHCAMQQHCSNHPSSSPEEY